MGQQDGAGRCRVTDMRQRDGAGRGIGLVL